MRNLTLSGPLVSLLGEADYWQKTPLCSGKFVQNLQLEAQEVPKSKKTSDLWSFDCAWVAAFSRFFHQMIYI